MRNARPSIRAAKPCATSACSYFASRFPNLLITTYAFGLQHCAEEPAFANYYPAEAQEAPLALDIIAGRLPQASLQPAASSTSNQSLVHVLTLKAVQRPVACVQERQVSPARSSGGASAVDIIAGPLALAFGASFGGSSQQSWFASDRPFGND